MSIGFLPCFAKYNHKEFPTKLVYNTPAYVIKLKNLVSAFIDSESPYSIKNNIGGKMITPIRPDSKASKNILKWCEYPMYDVFRIDYGDNPFRVVFALCNDPRVAYIYIIDTTHRTYPQKR